MRVRISHSLYVAYLKMLRQDGSREDVYSQLVKYDGNRRLVHADMDQKIKAQELEIAALKEERSALAGRLAHIENEIEKHFKKAG